MNWQPGISEGISQPILQTKIHSPRRVPNTIERERLISKLQHAPHRKLTLLSAAAGYGKTTLLRDWAAQQQHPLAWLTLDPEDNHTSRFAHYLQAAWLERQGTAPIERPSPYQLTADVPLDQLLPMLINQLEAENEPVTFIFDDVHHIQSSAVLGAFSFLIANLPARAQVIIAGRTDPDLSLARLRAHGYLDEFRSSELRFTLDEMTRFIEVKLGRKLPETQLNDLMRKTEGWPAGVQLVVHLLKERHQLPQIIEGFHGDHPYVFEYLTGEVLEGLEASLRTFLIRSSILPGLEASLCDEVLERDDSQEVLSRIQAENLFLEPANPLHTRFRYHPLFQDYLRKRFKESLSEQEQRRLHQRASQALQSRGHQQLAIPHAIQADDLQTAIRLVSDHAQQAMNVGDSASIQRWIAWLPRQAVEDNPRLAIWYTWSLAVSGKLKDIDHWLSLLEAAQAPAAVDDSSAAEAFFQAATIRATVSRFRGDTARTLKESARALEALPPDRPILKAIAVLNQGHAYFLCGQVDKAIPLLQKASDLAQRADHRYVSLSAKYHLGKCYLVRGDFEQAELTFGAAEGPIEDDLEHGLRCVYHLGMGILRLERGELEKAIEDIEHSIRLSQIIRDFIFMREALETLVRLHLLRGEVEYAASALEELDSLLQPMGEPAPTLSIAGLRARVECSKGFHKSAWQWACGTLARHFQTPDSSQRTLLMDALHIYFQSDERAPNSAFESQLIQLLSDLAEQAKVDHRLLDWSRLSLYETRARFEMSRRDSALSVATSVLQNTPAEAAQILLTGGPELWPLWQWLLAQEARNEHGESALLEQIKRVQALYRRKFGDELKDYTHAAAAEEDLPEDLSEREAQVLRLLAQGQSSRQVAESLVITYNTARTHIRNIYRKLDVHSRLEAVQRAQELQVV
jgi:LuxR family maltose regulon positive regulatory protein